MPEQISCTRAGKVLWWDRHSLIVVIGDRAEALNGGGHSDPKQVNRLWYKRDHRPVRSRVTQLPKEAP